MRLYNRSPYKYPANRDWLLVLRITNEWNTGIHVYALHKVCKFSYFFPYFDILPKCRVLQRNSLDSLRDQKIPVGKSLSISIFFMPWKWLYNLLEDNILYFYIYLILSFFLANPVINYIRHRHLRLCTLSLAVSILAASASTKIGAWSFGLIANTPTGRAIS